MKKITGIFLLTAMLCGTVFAHSGKPKYHVIIDTDGGLDDMRALSMFLSGNDIRVLAITCSQGTLLPGSVFMKVSSLLSALHHEGIPVGISAETDAALPGWASFEEKIPWGEDVIGSGPDFTGESVKLLNETAGKYPDKLTLIALGSLKTYADWFRENPGIAGKIDRIIWSGNQDIRSGFNYEISPESYETIRKSGLKLEVVTGNEETLPVDQNYLNAIHNTGSVYAAQINAVHSRQEVIEKANEGRLYLRDDMVPFYLTAPLVFDVKTRDDVTFASINRLIPADFIYELIGRLLVSATATNNRVFLSFPVDTNLYKPEYAEMLNETIGKFGLIEWKAISLTNEIHGHTGIYSIIGAKMGIRAMDYFNVGINNLYVTTFAGNDPPLSCFNDGIQISTGATIGQGLVTISDSISEIPSAIFEFNGRKVRISATPEIAEQMQREIR
ncbi:MAG TPA: hypothetical protein ENO20_05205, partial [Bacteroides sp.]|nr:hypothetical protein [Bacteroides sp.]